MNDQAFPRIGNPPDLPSLVVAVRAVIGDPFTIGEQNDGGQLTVHVAKPTAWQPSEISGVQSAVNGAVDSTPQADAQNFIDNLPLFQKAILLTLLDQINQLRQNPTTVFPAVTPAQAIAAVRAKAATL